MYAYFRVRTNQICIVLSTEVPAYPKTFPGTNCVPILCQVLLIVVSGHKNSWYSPTGNVPQDNVPGRKNCSNNDCLPGQRPGRQN